MGRHSNSKDRSKKRHHPYDDDNIHKRKRRTLSDDDDDENYQKRKHERKSKRREHSDEERRERRRKRRERREKKEGRNLRCSESNEDLSELVPTEGKVMKELIGLFAKDEDRNDLREMFEEIESGAYVDIEMLENEKVKQLLKVLFDVCFSGKMIKSSEGYKVDVKGNTIKFVHLFDSSLDEMKGSRKEIPLNIEEKAKRDIEDYNAKYRSKSLVDIHKEKRREVSKSDKKQKSKKHLSSSEDSSLSSEDSDERRKRRRRREKKKQKKDKKKKKKKKKEEEKDPYQLEQEKKEMRIKEKKRLAEMGYLQLDRDDITSSNMLNSNQVDEVMDNARGLNSKFSGHIQTSFL